MSWVDRPRRRALPSPSKAASGEGGGGQRDVLAVAALAAGDDGGPELRMQALVYPACDAELATASAVEFASGFGFTAAAMRDYWSHYLGEHDPRDGDASPLRAGDLSGLPPAFVLTAAAVRRA